MALQQRTIRRYVRICEAYHAGFDLQGIKQLVGSRVTHADLQKALAWEREQVLLRSEIESLYDALLATRKLRRQANLILDTQYKSVMAKTRRFAIKEVQELIDAELEYSNRIRELAKAIDDIQGHAGLRSLPPGIFTADLEPDGGDGGS